MKKALPLLLCLLLILACLPAAFAADGDILLPEIPIDPPAAHLAGDINGDGKVNNKDLTRLAQYLTGRSLDYVEGSLDVNGDGRINNKDLTRLAQKLAGRNVQLFFGTKPAPAPLTIAAQPESLTVQEGDTVSLSVTVSGGTPPYSYRWVDSGFADIQTVTSASASDTLTLQAQTGYYPIGETIRCIVTDSADESVTSVPVTVTPVNPGGTPKVTISVPDVLRAGYTYTLGVSGYGMKVLPYRFLWFIDPPDGVNLRTYPADHEGLRFDYTPETTGWHEICVVMFEGNNDCWGMGSKYVNIKP